MHACGMSAIDYRAAAETVAYDLMGTCQSLQGCLENHEMEGYDAVMEFCHALDLIAWECNVCEWWTEASDVDDNDVCSGCRDDDS